MSKQPLYLRPLGLVGHDVAPPGALPLASGSSAFTACETARPRGAAKIAREVVDNAALGGWARRHGLESEAQDRLMRLTAPRAPFAGLTLDRPRVMAVINVTPDSFSDGGDRFDSGRAIADGCAMLEAGADLLDIGGESTRPGADPVPEEEELRRVVPVVRALVVEGALVSIDTRRARVMAAALEAGAKVINDVTALAGDPESLTLAAETGVPVVLMHMQGEPRTMQHKPTYEDAPLEIYDWLESRVAACEAAGIARERIAVDPGIGFGKSLQHNLHVLDHLALYHGLGCALLLGVSRKSFIGRLSGARLPKDRVPGSLAAALAGLERGVQIVRMHDVAETQQAIEVWRAIVAARPTGDLRASA